MSFGIFCLFVRYLITAEHRQREFEKGMLKSILVCSRKQKVAEESP